VGWQSFTTSGLSQIWESPYFGNARKIDPHVQIWRFHNFLPPNLANLGKVFQKRICEAFHCFLFFAKWQKITEKKTNTSHIRLELFSKN